MLVTFTDIVLFSTYFFLLFCSIFWLLVLIASEKEPEKKKLSSYPFFTAIVPAYNEEETITATLRSLTNLDYPKEKIEIIVVNDGSADHTPDLVREFCRCHPQNNIFLLNQKNHGKGHALNQALARARGEFFACLDADSFVHKNALKEMLPYFTQDQNIAAVCPLLKVKKPACLLQKVQWYEYIINMFYKELNARLDCIHVTPGPFSVYRTKIINDLGGYDEKNITEDLEIAIRLQKHHYRIIQTFDATVETVAPKTWHSLFWQRIRWYKGSVDNSLSYKSLIFNKQYGDFGFMRMPTILISGAVAVILTFTLLGETLTRLYHYLLSLSAVNFDFLTLLKNFHWQFNFLSLPFVKLSIASTLIAISLFVMFYSYKTVREKITHYGRTWLSLFTYLSVYALFISVVWIYILFMFIAKKKGRSWS